MKTLEEREEAAREYLDELVDGLLNDVVLAVEKEEAGALLKMERKDAVEFINEIWVKNYVKK